MTVWDDAAFTAKLAHANWMANPAIQIHLNERATGDPAREWLNGWARRYFAGENLRVLVLGCGEGWLERGIAEWPFVAHIDAVDVAASAVERAKATARQQGITKIAYDVVDLNHGQLAPDSYDVIVAHAVLHHVENLEHAYAQLRGALREQGTLILNEYIGPNRFQYGDDVLALMNELLSCLPRRLRQGVIEPRTYDQRERPTVEAMLASDPTEAVRSEELVSFTAKQFRIIERKDLGGTILQHLLYDIVQNFRFDAPRERSMLELLCTLEAMLIDRKRLPSSYALLAARKNAKGACRTETLPRPEAANDVDPDPLGDGTRKPVVRDAHAKGRVLTKHQLRALRIALVSTQEKRANLIQESARNAIREQLRFALSRTRPFTWVISRWAARANLKLEDDRAMLMLLEAFDRVS